MRTSANTDVPSDSPVARVSALAFLVVLAVVFGVFALVQRNSARAATAVAHQELLVSESQALLSSNRQLATLLAIEADRRQPSADTRDALMNAVLAEPLLQRTVGERRYGSDMAALAGDRVVVVSRKPGLQLPTGTFSRCGTGRPVDAKPGQRHLWAMQQPGPLDMSATADGLLLAVISRDGMIQLYSGRTLEPQGPPFPSGLGQFAPGRPTSR